MECFFSMGSCKNPLQYLQFSLTKISVSCDLILFFPWDWAGFCCPVLTKEDLFSHQHFMKFFSGSPWPWSSSGRDVGPNLTSKWAAPSAFKHLLFSCWSASIWQTFGITCSCYNWGMLCLYSFFKRGKKEFPGGQEDVPLLAGICLVFSFFLPFNWNWWNIFHINHGADVDATWNVFLGVLAGVSCIFLTTTGSKAPKFRNCLQSDLVE